MTLQIHWITSTIPFGTVCRSVAFVECWNHFLCYSNDTGTK